MVNRLPKFQGPKYRAFSSRQIRLGINERALVSRGAVSADVQGSHSQCNAVQKYHWLADSKR